MDMRAKQTFIAIALIAGSINSAAAWATDSNAYLYGNVTTVESAQAPVKLSKLTQMAIERNTLVSDLDKLVTKFSDKKHKAKVFAKEMANCMIPYRGFSPSKEGANIVLESITKIKSLAAAEYIRQRWVDETHTKIVGATLEIAMGLDEQDPLRRGEMIDKGLAGLTKLIGEPEAQTVLQDLTAWSMNLSVQPHAYEQQRWDVKRFQETLRGVTARSMNSDPVTNEIIKKVEKYNPGKIKMALSRAIQMGTTAATICAPGLATPLVSEFLNATFVAGTGGCESTKLVNELYYAKRLESRWKRINEETQMALTNHQLALAHKSPTVLATTEAILQQLVGDEGVSNVLDKRVLAADKTAEHPIQTSSDASGTARIGL
jgi:hypothetical protein